MFIEVREEPIPGIIKQLRKNRIEKVFNKDTSVFAKWQQDTPATIKECLDHDY